MFRVLLFVLAMVSFVPFSASAQTIKRRAYGNTGELPSEQMTRLSTVVAECWPWAVAGVRAVSIERLAGGAIRMTAVGTRVLSVAESQTHVAGGGILLANRRIDVTVTCTLTGARLTALAALLQNPVNETVAGNLTGQSVFPWTGPLADVRAVHFVRDGSAVRLISVTAERTRTYAEAVTDSEAGEDVLP
jgi:hypothetical protein